MIRPGELFSGSSPARRAASRREACALFVAAILLLLPALAEVAAGQTDASASTAPVVKRVVPRTFTPGVVVSVEGVRLGGGRDSGDISVIFVQNGREFAAEHGGSGYHMADLRNGPQELKATVPEGLSAGPCQLVVMIDGQRSEPYEVEVGAAVMPPTLSGLTPSWAIPGEHIWVKGSGFTGSETAELTDARGKTLLVENVGLTSDADTVAFVLPEEVAEGRLTLRLIEKRSGAEQASNALTLKVSRGAAPLQPADGWLESVAAGQWFSLVVYGNTIYDRVTRVEVSFRQDGHETVVPVEKGVRLRVRLPPTLKPGAAEMLTRAWVGDIASEWSEPFPYQVAAKPLAPTVHSLEMVPVRVEARFRQGGQVVATVPVSLDGAARARVPDGLRPDTVEVQTRVWRGGRPGAWSKGDNYSCCPVGSGDGTLPLPSLLEPNYIGPDTPESVPAHPGEGLLLAGEFHVGSVEELQVVLSQPGQRMTLVPESVPGRDTILVRLPALLAPGLWQVTLSDGATQTELPARLSVN